VFLTKVVEKIKNIFYVEHIFSRRRFRLSGNVENADRDRQTDRQDTDDNITRHRKVAMCVSDIEVKNTDTQLFNTYCFIIDSICLIA